jgi:hypothetical protein
VLVLAGLLALWMLPLLQVLALPVLELWRVPAQLVQVGLQREQQLQEEVLLLLLLLLLLLAPPLSEHQVLLPIPQMESKLAHITNMQNTLASACQALLANTTAVQVGAESAGHLTGAGHVVF